MLDITMDGIDRAIQGMKRNRAVGEDGVLMELITEDTKTC